MDTTDKSVITPIFRDFIQSYFEKDTGLSEQDWLKGKLQESGVDLNEEELEKYTADLVGSVKSFSESLRSLEKSKAEGKTAEGWLKEKIKETSKKTRAEELQTFNAGMDQANRRLLRNLKAEETEKLVNTSVIDVAAEQGLIDDFNSKATLEDGHYEALIDLPADGSVYGQDLFDIVIKDKFTGEKLENYQIIYGNDLQETIDLVEQSSAAGQTILVPEDMVDDVRKACPFKDIAANLGGTGRVMTKGTAFQLKDAENLLQKAPKTIASKLISDPEEALKEFTDNAFSSGVLAAGFTGALERLTTEAEPESFSASDFLGKALLAEDNDGIKTVAAGALATAVHKGLVTALPKDASPVVVANLASVGVENVKVLSQVADGTITLDEGIEHMGNMNVAMGFEFLWNKYATPMAAKLLNFIPVVGPFISTTIVAGGVLNLVKKPVKELILQGVKQVVPVVKSVAKKICNTVVETAKTVARAAKSVVKGIKNFISSLF